MSLLSMPYVLKRRSLASHLGDVVRAPFIFLMVGRMMALLLLPVIALSVLVVWLCGGRIGPMIWDQEFIVVTIGMVLYIALAAIPLALREWWTGSFFPEWSADGSQRFVETAKAFTHALLNQDLATASRLATGDVAQEIVERAKQCEVVPPMAIASCDLAARELSREELTQFDIERRISSKPRDSKTRAIVAVTIPEVLEGVVELVDDHGVLRVEGFALE
jgi:hypothetical protein